MMGSCRTEASYKESVALCELAMAEGQDVGPQQLLLLLSLSEALAGDACWLQYTEESAEGLLKGLASVPGYALPLRAMAV